MVVKKMNKKKGRVEVTHFVSVRQPYARDLVRGDQVIEYRSWALPKKHVGKWLAIQASNTFTKVEKEWMDWDEASEGEKEEIEQGFGKIIGAVKFSKTVLKSKGTEEEKAEHHWVVGEFVEFGKYVKIKGQTMVREIKDRKIKRQVESILNAMLK